MVVKKRICRNDFTRYGLNDPEPGIGPTPSRPDMAVAIGGDPVDFIAAQPAFRLVKHFEPPAIEACHPASGSHPDKPPLVLCDAIDLAMGQAVFQPIATHAGTVRLLGYRCCTGVQ